MLSFFRVLVAAALIISLHYDDCHPPSDFRDMSMRVLSFSENEFAHFRLYAETLTKYDNPKTSALALQALSDTSPEFKKIRFVRPSDIDIAYETIQSDNLSGFYTNCGLAEFYPDENNEIYRRRSHVGRFRGQIIDIDTYLSWEDLEQVVVDFSPTMAVATSKKGENFKAHLYFLYGQHKRKPIPLSQEQYKGNHLALAYRAEAVLGTGTVDKQNFSPAQAFRIPGCYHQKPKADLFLTQIVYCNPDHYLDDIHILGITDKERYEAIERYKAEKLGQRTEYTKKKVELKGEKDPLISRYPDTDESSRNVSLYEFTLNRLFIDKQLTRNEALGAAAYENQTSNEPPLEEQEVITIVDSAFTAWQERFTPRALVKMRGCDSKTARELVFADALTAKDDYNEKKKDSNWNENQLQENGFDYSDRDRFTSLISDTSILGRIGQKYSGEIVCNKGLGILTYNSATGTWIPGENFVPERCMHIISGLVKDPVIYRYFLNSKTGEFQQEKFDSHFKEFYSVRKLEQLTKGVHFLKEFQIEATDLDSHLNLINCRNGVIDLYTGEIIEHHPEFKITKSLNASYNELPFVCEKIHEWYNGSLWSKSVFDTMEGDIEMCLFLQRFLGYTMLGGNDLQAMAFFYGTGSNGKSVIIETLAYLFGSYHAALKAEFLMADRNTSSPGKFDAFARLRGCRLVTSSELAEDQYWAEETIKDITGNDLVQAKFMGKGIFEFTPQATFIVRGNNEPSLRGNDYGILRRFLKIGFGVNFDKNGKKDSQLRHKLKEQSELDSLLGWLVRGCLEYQRIGLQEPEKVLQLNREFREVMNPLQTFIADCFEPTDDPAKGLTSDEVISIYSTWAKDNDKSHVAREDFIPKLKKNGLTKSLTDWRDSKTVRVYPLMFNAEWKTAQLKRNVIEFSSVFKGRR